MPLTIKLPPKATNADSPLEHTEPPPRRRTLGKRQVAVDSEDDDDSNKNKDERPHSISEKHSARPPMKRSRTRELTGTGDDDDNDMDFNIDVEADDSLPRPSSSSKAAERKLAKKSSLSGLLPPKKKRAVILSDDEQGDYRANEDDASASFATLDDDDDFVEQRRLQKHKSSSAPNRGKVGKSGGKNMKTKETKEISMKDERKQLSAVRDSPLTAGVKRPRPKELQLPKDEDNVVVDVLGGSTSQDQTATSNSPPRPKADTPPPQKKRKLPTIKKNKPTGPTAPSTPTTGPTTSKPPLATVAGKPAVNDSTGAIPSAAPPTGPRKPSTIIGSTDFDLRNASVYAELFKGPGGNTPRSGLNRREKDEERRKELNRMRDEAKAARAAEAAHTFDLQGQGEKISRFEERLRQERSTVLYPNFLAAKFKEDYDEKRRRRHEQERSQRPTWETDRSKEEGETSLK